MATGFDTRAPSTIVTIQLSGQVEFTIPFEFLARKFVVVTLLGADRKVLTLNTDYRFVASNKIQFINVDTSGYTNLELRRVTSTTDRLVTFTDGSILRATDMNLAQVQTMHVAEEARDMTADAIGTNDDGNLDARNRKLVNLSYGSAPNDAVAYGQLQEFDGSALNSKVAAEAARDIAVAAASSAITAKDAASLSELNAENYAAQAALSAQDAATSRDGATSSKVDAEAAADRAEAASGPATEVFNRLQDVEDKVDVANANSTSAVAIAQSALIEVNQVSDDVTSQSLRITELEQYPKVRDINDLLQGTTGVTMAETECFAVEHKTHYDVTGIARFPAVTGITFSPFTLKVPATRIPATSGQLIAASPSYVPTQNGVLPVGTVVQVTAAAQVTTSWVMFNFSIKK